ncbi:MAG: M48 family metallopeptidase [Deltaproteobacteria bacterium]|nr:M48 family metallopeptidase [Deltaproteobacteria bacterium]
MNNIAILILTALIIETVLNFYSEFLNMNSVKTNLPDEFKDLYDEDTYKKSQEYLKANTKFGWVSSFLDLFILMIFWFCKGFPLLDQFVRGFGYGTVVSGLIFMGIILGVKFVISLPFNIYSTFVLEERFGFNKTTPKTFVVDLIKAIVLGTILGTILLSVILAFFEYSGEYAWIYCYVGVTTFIFLIQYLYPVFIMPLFNKFEEIEDGDLKTSLMEYAKSIDFPLTKIFRMDGSKRSTKSNAFFTGFGKNKRIVLFDTLIEKHTVEELVAVLAHEMGHFKKNHIKKLMFLSILQMGVIFYLLSFFLHYDKLFNAFYMNDISIYAGLIFFSMLFSPISFFLNIMMQHISRRHEYEADKFAVDTTSKSKNLVNALKKLSVDNLSNLNPHPLYVFLNYSHPPVMQRVEAMRKIKG